MPPDPSAKRPRRPVRIGKYEVVAHVATGGMGAVYKAIDTVLKREVALKVLPPEMASKPLALERFRREARNAARLRHENIVTIYEFDQSGSTCYLAMEFIDGIDLHEYIERKQRLDPEEARLITIQAARALEQAHTQGVVHRDIKPSNFLIMRKGDKLIVKMSDFGLARETSDEEARVTRDGTTVGTVDYMAPEQARDCGKADCRSDIYSLGCTLFHMLTGKAPFPEGSLPERLYKHAHQEPPDLRRLNPRVSEGMCAVVRRMLAKQADDRYPTPGALLKDLTRLESATAPQTGADVLAGLALAADERVKQPKRRPASTERVLPPAAPPPPFRRGRRGEAVPVDPDQQADGERSIFKGPWVWVLGGAALALLLAGVGIFVATRSPPPGPSPEPGSSVVVVPPPPDTGRGADGGVHPTDPPQDTVGAAKPEWPALYKPSAPLAVEALRKQFLGPWEGHADPGIGVPILRMARVPVGGGSYPSLQAACNAAAPGKLSVIEIEDNGPLYEAPVAVADRSLVIRAARGYRPLVVWEGERPRMEVGKPHIDPGFFLTLARGNLTLDRIDLVGRWNEASRPFLVHVTDGDFLARDCTFSLTGKQPADLGVVRFDRSPASGPLPATPARCRLSRCLARGPGLVVLDLDAPGADVLCDGCLVVGTQQPLIQVAGHNRAPTVLRLLRSTFVAGQALLHVHPATPADIRPELHIRAWDVLLTRPGTQTGGQMVVLGGSTQAARLKWQATNSLYVGWQKLLAASYDSADDLRAWQTTWQRTEGDLALARPWPAVPRLDPAEASAEDYRTAPAPTTPVGYAATSGPGPLGCDLAALPPARTNWLALTFDPSPAPTPEMITAAAVPPVPNMADGHYHGGRIDLAATPDLGSFLDEMQRTRGLGPRVVLHLAGSGEHKTRPIRIKGSSLVLYFEPGGAEADPPTLVPHDSTAPDADALIDLDGGSLEMIGGGIRFPDSRQALMPPHAVKVRGGDLRLFHCRLQGPLKDAPPRYQGLVRFEGASGEPDPTKVRGCALNESVLVSAKSALHLVGGGARIRLRQCILLSTADALYFDPGPTARPRLDVQCLLEQTTVVGRKALVRLSDAPQLQGPVDPIVLEARFCAFLNPFADMAAPLVLAANEGALGRGLLLWQGSGNAFDWRLAYDVVPKAVGSATWARLWGRAWERRQALDVPFKQTLDLARLDLERLAVPPGLVRPVPGEERRPPGADVELLGLGKKGKGRP